MVFPAIRMHQLYSLNLYDGLDIIFEDLNVLNMEALEKVVRTKQLGNISIVDKILNINTDSKTITICGHQINSSTYIITQYRSSDITLIQYKCSDSNILTAIEYLYHMYKNLT
jgi:hypothetical protein